MRSVHCRVRMTTPMTRSSKFISQNTCKIHPSVKSYAEGKAQMLNLLINIAECSYTPTYTIPAHSSHFPFVQPPSLACRMWFSGYQASSLENYLSHDDRGWAIMKVLNYATVRLFPPMKLVSFSNIPLCGFRHSHQIFSIGFG